MNIYVDGMFFRRSGIGRVYENVLAALSESGEVTGIHTVVPGKESGRFAEAFPPGKVKATFVDFEPLGLEDFTRKAKILSGLRPRPDLYFFPNVNVPIGLPGKVVATVNDLTPMSRHADFRLHERMGFRMIVAWVLRRSTRVVCISDTVRGEIARVFHMPEKRLRVIYPWVSEDFAQGGDSARRNRPMVAGDYLLFVGNRFAHKNLGCLVAAIRGLIAEFPGLKLVVCGKRIRPGDAVDAAAREPEWKDRVVQVESGSDEEIRELYAHARALVFPTFAEGFGLPPLEAMAMGVPSVCSDIPVIREVCGDAVRYADPGDPASFSREIRRILSGDAPPEAAGRERVRSFRKEESVGRYLRLFREVVSAEPPA